MPRHRGAGETRHIGPALHAITTSEGYHREWRFRRKDGSTFTADVIGAMMPDGNLIGMVRDTTERNRTESRFRRLVDSNAQGVSFSKAAGPITAANDAFLRITGYTRDELEAGAIDWRAITPVEHAEADRRALDEIIPRPRRVHAIRERVYPPRRIARARSPRCGIVRRQSGGGRLFVLDLTERKKPSNSSIARSGASARSPEESPTISTTSSRRFCSRWRSSNPPRPTKQLSALLDTVHRSAQRGAELVQQVLSFARGVEGRHVLVNPLHLMRDFLMVLRDTFPRSIDVRLESKPDLWNISADPTQIHQVFMNLSINARDAMTEGGQLSVKMENVVLDDTYAAMNIDARPGTYVRITVADTGPGIPPDVRD
jgi:PAS domain S-box-containing protein